MHMCAYVHSSTNHYGLLQFRLKVMTFKVVLLAIVVNSYITEAAVKRNKMLGGADYLPCESCNIPKSDYPKEG